MEAKIIIENKIEALTFLTAQLEELFEKWNLPLPLTMSINLVLEEAVSNVIFYAFTDGGNHEIEISISLIEDELTVTIEDDGIPFDPTSNKPPDITLNVEERPIGGLGIFLMSKIMDNILYKREQGKNSLTLKKKI